MIVLKIEIVFRIVGHEKMTGIKLAELCEWLNDLDKRISTDELCDRNASLRTGNGEIIQTNNERFYESFVLQLAY